jgi:hypothetical protein
MGMIVLIKKERLLVNMKTRKILFLGTYIIYFLLTLINNLILSKEYVFAIDNIWHKSIQTTIFVFFSLLLLFLEGIAMHRLKSIRTLNHVLVLALTYVHLYLKVNWIVITMLQLVLMLILFFSVLYTEYDDEIDEEKRIIAFNYMISNLIIVQLFFFSVVKTNLMYFPLIVITLYYCFIKTFQLKYILNQQLSKGAIVKQYIVLLVPIIGWFGSTYHVTDTNVEYVFYIFPIIITFVLMYFSLAGNRKLYLKSIKRFENG